MNKKEALEKLSEHLDLLANYRVMTDNAAGTLYLYISEIIEQIQEVDPDIAKAKALNNLVELWGTLKDPEKDDDTK
jgi:hypothetical protein